MGQCKNNEMNFKIGSGGGNSQPQRQHKTKKEIFMQNEGQTLLRMSGQQEEDDKTSKFGGKEGSGNPSQNFTQAQAIFEAKSNDQLTPSPDRE